MKLQITYIAFLSLATSILAAQSDPRFMIASHPIVIRHLNPQTQSDEVQNVIFKLDTEIGSVWRFDTNGFVRILVRDLVSQKAFAERQNEEVRKRLRAITIPEISFQNVTLSNALVYLQKQIRELDSAVEAGSDHFIRVKLVGVSEGAQSAGTNTVAKGDAPVNYGESPITFQARMVSAWDALKICTEVSYFQVCVVDGCVVVRPCSMIEWIEETRVYEVSPLLRDRVTGSSITNVFAKLGFNLGGGAGMIYSSELDTIVLREIVPNQEQFSELLLEAGLARLSPGRFRLITSSLQSWPILFLLDDKTGETWQYRHYVAADGAVSEYFNRVRTDLYADRPCDHAIPDAGAAMPRFERCR